MISKSNNSVKKHLMLLAVLLFIIGSTGYATNGYFRHAYGAQYSGLAGAGVAMYLSPFASATNPAAIAFMGKMLDIEFSFFNPNREYTVTGNPSGFPGTFPLTPGNVDSDSKLFVIPGLAFSIPLSGGNAIGLAIFGNGGMNTNYNTKTFNNPQLTFDAPTGVDLSQLFVAGTFAKKFGENHSIGVTGIFAFQRFKAEGLFAFGGFSSDPTKLTNNGHATSTGFGARFGYLGEFGVVSIGASYQTKISMSEFDEYAGLFADGGDFDIPSNWTAGIAIKATPALTLAADVQQVKYTDVNSVSNPLDLLNNSPVLQNGSPNQNFIPLGTEGAWGFGWDDMTIFKAGIQYEAAPGFMLRGGFSTGGQPIAPSEVMFNILAPGVMEQHITLGLTKALNEKLSLNVGLMHALSHDVTGPNPFEAPEQQQIELKMNQFEGDIGLSIAL